MWRFSVSCMLHLFSQAFLSLEEACITPGWLPFALQGSSLTLLSADLQLLGSWFGSGDFYRLCPLAHTSRATCLPAACCLWLLHLALPGQSRCNGRPPPRVRQTTATGDPCCASGLLFPGCCCRRLAACFNPHDQIGRTMQTLAFHMVHWRFVTAASSLFRTGRKPMWPKPSLITAAVFVYFHFLVRG